MTTGTFGDGDTYSSAEVLDSEVVQDFEEEGEPLQDLEPLSYFGTDFDVHGLVRRLNQGDVVIPNFDPVTPGLIDLKGFQRRFVWKKPQMDRFIESLLLGFPVPGIFLVQQRNKQQLVLDGQQRLRTLQAFYSGALENGEPFALENVEEDFAGLTYATLEPEMRRALDNTFMHATVTKFSIALGGDKSVYSLFERLNTGGTNLYPQEIRVALYSGSLVETIRQLNGDPAWRELFGPVSQRLKDQELILRFWAFSTGRDSYERPLKAFLNNFLKDHQDLQGLNVDEFADVFRDTCVALNEAFGKRAFRHTGQINAALADSLLIGVSERLTRGKISDIRGVVAAKQNLLNDAHFVAAIGRATADEDRVAYRLETAVSVFSSIN